jgi:hypothetical protein
LTVGVGLNPSCWETICERSDKREEQIILAANETASSATSLSLGLPARVMMCPARLLATHCRSSLIVPWVFGSA